MNRRSKLWLVVASLANLINAGGGGYAVAMGEESHALTHAALLVLGTVWAWWLGARSDPQDSLGAASEERLERLQQSVDAMAIELERMSEAQRFMAKLEHERVERVPLNPRRD